MKQFIQDGHTLVLRALRTLIGAELAMTASEGVPFAVIEAVESRDWASATFVGQLHHLELRFEGMAAAVKAAVDRLVTELPEVDASMIGHSLAEAAVTGCEAVDAVDGQAITRVKVEALTIEE